MHQIRVEVIVRQHHADPTTGEHHDNSFVEVRYTQTADVDEKHHPALALGILIAESIQQIQRLMPTAQPIIKQAVIL